MHGNDQLDPAVNRVHVLWDESCYWALMLWRALLHGGVPFRLVRAAEIASGLLQRNPPGVLFVPGGWARFKSAALGPGGRRAVAAYLEAGGAYLGFCGGAGLALPEHGGLALCPLCRKPVSERLPNFSGSVSAALHGHELVPEGLPAAVRLPVWWPSQFAVPKAGDVWPATWSRPRTSGSRTWPGRTSAAGIWTPGDGFTGSTWIRGCWPGSPV